LLGLAAIGSSCSTVGPYVWVDEYVPPQDRDARDGYRIVPGDVLSVRVYNQDGMSSRERVRQDGKISLPFLSDVQAAGFTPDALTKELQHKFKDYINSPIITVAVEESRPVPVPVIGEVARPGQYPLEPGAGVLEALAAAGGLSDFAHRDRIFVLRRHPALTRIRLTFEALTRGRGRAASLGLQAGDSVVVE